MKSSWLLLLGAKTVSTLGSRLTIVAMPLIAILLLNATPFEMGVLEGSALLPSALLSPFIGALIDRRSKRNMLIVANCVSAMAMSTIVIAHHYHVLTIVLLTVIAFCAATIGMAEDLALFSFIPKVVERSYLAVANSYFRSITAGAKVAGTALAGLLIAALTAPGTIAVDAATFIIAALCISLIPIVDSGSVEIGVQLSYFAGLRDGFRFVVRNAEFITVVLTAVFVNLFGSSFDAIGSLFIVRDLHVPAAWYAAALTAGAAAGALGALASGKVSKLFDIRVLLAMGVGLVAISLLVIALLQGTPETVAIAFGGCCAVTSFGSILVSVALGTILQESAPENILGSVAGIFTAIMSGIAPIGAVGAGLLGTLVGLRYTLIGSAAGLLAVSLLLSAYCEISARSRYGSAR